MISPTTTTRLWDTLASLLDIFETFCEWKWDARDVAEIQRNFHFL